MSLVDVSLLKCFYFIYFLSISFSSVRVALKEAGCFVVVPRMDWILQKLR